MGRRLGSAYVLHEVIGRGAVGEVWRGQDDLGRPLAFKLLYPALAHDPDVVERFVRERGLLAAIDSPHVVRVRDLVVEGGTLAIVMDLVEGGDLRSWLRKEGTAAPADVAEIGAQIADGLTASHRLGIVHRDVKPENVLLDAGPPLSVRLSDFGISRLAGNEHTTALIGTPLYMAPELHEGRAPEPAADLYGLGIVLYELTCGVTPFAGRATTPAVQRAHVHDAPGRPAGVPDALWGLIARLLAKDPAARPAGAALVAEQLRSLRPALAGAPAAARLPTPPAPWGVDSADTVPSPHTPASAGPRPASDPRLSHPDEGSPPPGRKRFAVPLLTGALAAALVAAGSLWWLALREDPAPGGASPQAPAATQGAAEASPGPVVTPAPRSPTPETGAVPGEPGEPPETVTVPPPPTPTGGTVAGSPPGPTPGPLVTGEPGSSCRTSSEPSGYGSYTKAYCTNQFLYEEGGVKLVAGRTWVVCQAPGTPNPQYKPGQTNTWWFFTKADAGGWQWFPETLLAQGASDRPINGIPRCG